MWFYLSLLALFLLVARRSTEKQVTGSISSMALAWLQQATALPFMFVTLFFTRFYWPGELSSQFWALMAVYVLCLSIDSYLYFKALSIADISYVAPLITLVAISYIVGAYFVLGQVPSVFGFTGAVLIVAGAALTYAAKRKDIANRKKNKLALLLILLLVVLRGFFSNIEVQMLQESNPATFNFYSSVLSVPLILLVSIFITYSNRKDKYKDYWKTLKVGATKQQWLLVFIGITYTVNMLATYQAKLIAPNAGYVGAVKSASVLPMMLIGLFWFKEKIAGIQWLGLALIAAGLILLALN